MTPRNASSGARQADAGLIQVGNPELRKVLIELAHRLIRMLDPKWGQLAAGMLQRGKPKNVVVAAVANRWCGCTTNCGRDNDHVRVNFGSGSTKGVRPSRLPRCIDLKRGEGRRDGEGGRGSREDQAT